MPVVALQNAQRATQSGQFTWLHLTDLHVGMSSGAHLWPNVEEEVLRDLEKVVAKTGPIDVIFFTGDLTQTGTKSEFQAFDKVLATIRAKLNKLGSDPLFLAVPGNHDLVRPDKDGAIIRALNEWAQDSRLREQFWTRPNCDYRKAVVEAFSNWSQWATNAMDWSSFEDVKRDAVLPGDFVATWARNEIRIGILGLNTAALQLAGGNYLGRLSLHISQVSQLVEKLYVWVESHDACFLLTHHDPTWLDTEGLATLNGEFARPGRFAVHLCGHRHAQSRTLLREGGAAPRRINIGRSLFGIETYEEEGNRKERLHGYSVGTVQINRKRSMRLWPRRDELKQAGHRVLGPDVSDELESDDGTHSEELGPSPRAGASAPDGLLGRNAGKSATVSNTNMPDGVGEIAITSTLRDEGSGESSFERPVFHANGTSGGLPEKRSDGARLEPTRAEELRMLVARNDLNAVLTALQLAGSHQRDKELRRFAFEKLGELSSLEHDFADRKLSAVHRRTELASLRRELLEKIDHHEHEMEAGAALFDLPSIVRSPIRSDGPDDPRSTSRTPVLQCVGLAKSLGQFRLHPVDFSLEHGRIAAVIGPNGAGKTTLLRMLARELQPSAGAVKIGDRNDRDEPLDHPVTFVPQIPETWNGTLLSHLRRRAAFFGCDTEEKNNRVIEDAAQLLDLWDYLDSPHSALSAGYRMRAAIASAMMMANLGVLILDEPLALLDPASQQRLLRQLYTRARDMGTAIVVASQHVPEIESVADVVLMVVGGRTRRLSRDVAPGYLFELRSDGSKDVLSKRLEELQQSGSVEAYSVGMSTVLVRFREPQSMYSVLAKLADTGISGIFDITNSGLAEHHSPLLSEKDETDEP